MGLTREAKTRLLVAMQRNKIVLSYEVTIGRYMARLEREHNDDGGVGHTIEEALEDLATCLAS